MIFIKPMLKGLLGICTLVLISGFALAQQRVPYSQYMFNGAVLNPAYVGNKNYISAEATYRKQGPSIEGSPEIYLLSVDGPLRKKKMALGAYVANVQMGAQSDFTGAFSYAYRVRYNDDVQLSMGLGMSFNQHAFDPSRVVAFDENDPNIPRTYDSKLFIDASTGLFLSTDRAYVGVSAFNLISSFTDNLELNQADWNYKRDRYYNLTSGYIFRPSTNWGIYPSVFVTSDFKTPMKMDLNTLFMFKNAVWAGASFRTDERFFNKGTLPANCILSFIVQYYMNSNLRLGYAFDYGLNKENSVYTNAHEVSLGYLFRSNRSYKELSSRYF